MVQEEKIPLVSCIITTFNRSERLKKAIESVIDQTFEDWELIIVDDASVDKTKKVVEKYMKKDSRIRYIRRNENWGSHSRPKNDGGLSARAELIAYLDDDNIWLKDHLMVLYKALEASPRLHMVYGDRWLIDDEKKMPKAQGIAFDWHPAILPTKNYIDTGDVLIRKSVLEKLGGWDESLKKFADWNLWVRFAKAGFTAERVPMIISEYHIHPFMAQLRHQSLVGQDGRVLPTFSPDACKVFPEKTIYPSPPKTRVAVLTLSWHRLDYLKETIASMREKAGYEFDHYLVLNEYTEEEEQWAKDNNFHHVILNKENVGCPAAYNQGIDAIKNGSPAYDVIVLTDNDVKFKTDNWLSEVVDLFERTTKLVVSPYVEGLRDNPGGSPRVGFAEAGLPPRGYIGEHYLGFVRHMGNIVQALPASFFNNWRFDTNTFKHGTQSFQVAGAAFSRGFALAYMEKIYVEHLHTTAKQEVEKPEYFEELKKAKQEKYKL